MVEKNLSREKLFGIMIDLKFDKSVQWKKMSNVKIESNLKKLNFPSRFIVTEIFNKLKIQNVYKNKTEISDFVICQSVRDRFKSVNCLIIYKEYSGKILKYKW